MENNFRGKRLGNGEFVLGHYVYQELANKHFIVTENASLENPYTPSYFTYNEVDPTTVGQYIGISEFFDGDIIKITYDTDYSEVEKSLHYIKYQINEDYPAFDLVPWIDCEMNALSWLLSNSDPSVLSYEIIGNIHEDKDLLES